MSEKRINIIVNQSQAKTAVAELDRSMKGLGGTVNTLNQQNNQYNTQLNRTSINIRNTTREVKQLEAESRGLNTTMSKLAIAISAVFSARELVRFADAWTVVGNKIRQATNSLEEFQAVQSTVYQIAQSGRSNIEGVALAFQRIDNAVKEFGFSQGDVLDVVDGLTKAFKSNGQTAQEVSSVLIQLSQAFAKGRLDGDELRSVMEASLPVSRAIAKEFGVNVGQLKDLGEQGLLVSERVFKAVVNELPAFQAAFDKAIPTVGDSLTVLDNGAKRLVGTFNEITGAADTLALLIIDASKAFDQLSDIMASGAYTEFADLFAGQITRVLMSATDLANELGITYAEVQLSTAALSSEITKLLKNAFLNAIPNIRAFVQIATVELLAGSDKLSAAISTIFDFDNLTRTHKEKMEEIKKSFKTIDDVREQTINGILKQNEAEKKASEDATQRAKIKILEYKAELAFNKELLEQERPRTATVPVDPKKVRDDKNAAKRAAKEQAALDKRIIAGEDKADDLFSKQFAESDLLLNNLNSENDVITKSLENRVKIYSQYGKIINDINAGFYEQERAQLELSISEQTFAEEQRLAQELADIQERQARVLENKNLTDFAQVEAVRLYGEQIAAQEAITEQRLTEIREQGIAARERLDKAERDTRLRQVGELGQSLINFGQGQSRKIFEIGKKLALAQATVSLPSAVIDTFKNNGGMPWGLVPAAAMAATGLKNIQTIKSTTFDGGGSVPSVGAGGSATIPQMPEAPEQVQSLSIIGAESLTKELQDLSARDDVIPARTMLRYMNSITAAKRIGP